MNKNVTASEIINCYGKHRVDQKKGDSCKRRNSCPWGEACLSLANESAENYHYHKANISIGNMLFDDDCFEQKDLSDTEREIFDAKKEISAMSSRTAKNNTVIELENLKLSESSYAEVLKVLVELADMYFKYPSSFDCVMRKIYKNQNQSDVAREKNITRAGLNKRLLSELGIAQKRNSIQEQRDRKLEQAKQSLKQAEEKVNDRLRAFSTMTETEFAIYKICAEDGCLSATSVAAQTGFSRQTIYTTLHNLREKYNINLTLSPYQREKK